MLDDLIARLTAKRTAMMNDKDMWLEYRNPDGPEAATALEALRAENERLREAAEGYLSAVQARLEITPKTTAQSS